MRYTLTVRIDGITIINHEYRSLLAAQVAAFSWCAGDFVVEIRKSN